MPLRSPFRRSAGTIAASLLLASALAACSGPEKPAATSTPAPANSVESGVRTMTGAIPRARDAAADMNQRSAENAAAANAVQ